MNRAELADAARFLTPAEVAELLQLTPAEVMTLIDSGELPAIRLSALGAWRIERQALEEYFSAQYEQTRMMSRWNGSDLGSVVELFG